MRPGLVVAFLVAALAANAYANAGGLARPDAVLAGPQELPAGAGGPAATLDWPEDGRVACDGACRLAVPAQAEGDLWVAWDGARTPGFTAALGGVPAVPAFDAARAGPVSGGEELRLWGRGEATLVVVPRTTGVPELAALVPANLGHALGSPRGHGDPSRAAPDCLEEEVADLGVAGCLRFTTGVANVGDTPLALSSRERADEAAMAQHLPGGDRSVGLATYHPGHGHFHYARFVSFDLHARDAATGLRGDVVGGSAKTGFCMVDFGPVPGAPVRGGKTYWREGCAPGHEHLAMGITPGWYDIYRWFLPEQLVDPTGLPDGTYELVVTVDPAGTLVEGNPLDNRASVVFAWQAGTATVLAGHGLYRLTPQPS